MRGQIRKRVRQHVTSWAVVIYLGRDPDTQRKRYRWSTHKTERETTEGHLTQLLAQAQAGGGIPPAKLLLRDYLDQWLRDYATGACAPSTFRGYQFIVRRHVIPALGTTPISRLTAQAILGYLGTLRTRRLSATTALNHYRLLHEALQHALEWGLIARHPMDFVPPPRRATREMRVWDEEQVRLFLAEARRSSKYYEVYLTAVLTGMRQAELLGLRWQDLDLVLGTATVQQTLQRIGGAIVIGEPKTARSRRQVALPSVVCEALRQLRTQQAAERRAWGAAYQDRGLVFAQGDGRPLHAHNLVRRDFQPLIRRVGLPRIRFHDLRHTHASHLLRSGAHARLVADRLGHSSPAFTLAVYGHVLPGMHEEAARKVAERILGIARNSPTGDPAEGNRAEPLDTHGAGGRSRTADTGIFSPPPRHFPGGTERNEAAPNDALGLVK